MTLRIPSVRVHPVTLKYLQQQHPWITKDTFTEKFPQKELFLSIPLPQNKTAIILHDPEHPRVKGRLWSFESESPNSFFLTIQARIQKAIQQRQELLESGPRDHLYLCYGEADALPGLFLLKLGPVLLIQTFAFFWEHHPGPTLWEWLANDIATQLSCPHVAWQQRTTPGQSPVVILRGNELPKNWHVQDHGIKLELRAEKHDWGIYTDMSGLREKLLPQLWTKKKSDSHFLNLFAYTGIFSLLALKQNIETTSVDLSPHYMTWLEDNITLNHFTKEQHHSVVASAESALKKFPANTFDMIVCDPPTFFHHKKGGKSLRSSSLDFYRDQLLAIDRVARVGASIFLAINTHSVTRQNFQKTMQGYLQEQGLHWKKVADLQTLNDAPLLPHFPEGDVIKGILWKKTADNT